MSDPIVGGVVQPDYTECSDAPLPGLVYVPVPGEKGSTNIIFSFGSGIVDLVVGEIITFPVPDDLVGMSMTRYRIRLDVSASIEFEIQSVADIEDGPLVALTGTMPSVTDQWGESDPVAFTPVILTDEMVLAAMIATVDAGVKQATLLIQLEEV